MYALWCLLHTSCLAFAQGFSCCADARAAVLSALSSYSKAGFDGITKAKAVARLAASLDSSALDAYATQLMHAFVTGSLTLGGILPACSRTLALQWKTLPTLC